MTQRCIFHSIRSLQAIGRSGMIVSLNVCTLSMVEAISTHTCICSMHVSQITARPQQIFFSSIGLSSTTGMTARNTNSERGFRSARVILHRDLASKPSMSYSVSFPHSRGCKTTMPISGKGPANVHLHNRTHEALNECWPRYSRTLELSTLYSSEEKFVRFHRASDIEVAHGFVSCLFERPSVVREYVFDAFRHRLRRAVLYKKTILTLFDELLGARGARREKR